MRLILKTKDRLVNIFWVFYKQNKIMGWYASDFLKKELDLPDEFHLESHFIYPQDGNFHFSHKSFRKDCEEFIAVYWDKVKIKIIQNNNRHVEWKTREEFKENILGHMVPQFKPEPLENVRHYFFGTLGFNIFDGEFKHSKFDRIIEEKDITDDDLVVDVSKLNNHMVNISSLLRQPEIQFSGTSFERFSKSQKISDTLILELVCMTNPNITEEIKPA